MSKDSWFRCSNPRCCKWRCVDPSVADLLRGVEFFRPEATDLDWHQWLSDARTRYAVAQQRCDGAGAASLGMDGEGGFADADAVTPEVDDGAATPDSDGARAPSDGEVASEGDNPGADEGLLQVAALELPHVVGGGGVSAQYDQGVHAACRR